MSRNSPVFLPGLVSVALGGYAIAGRGGARWAVVLGCAATLGLLASGGTGEFVYFRF